MKNLPMDLLRTFVTINTVGGFTQAGELLGRSQPAISLQIKRLEELLDVALFQRNGKLKLTEEGEVLYGYAQTILEVNDTAITRLSTPSLSGAVKVGIPNDFEASFLPVLLSKFTRAYPSVTLDVRSDISVTLREDFKRGVYDFVMTMDSSHNHQFSEGDFVLEPLAWVANSTFDLSNVAELPLVVYPKGCVYRSRMTQALNSAKIPWRVIYSSSSLMGITSAIKSGLGISAMAVNAFPSDSTGLIKSTQLPVLGQVSIGFNYDRTKLSAAAALLLNQLLEGLKQNRDYSAAFTAAAESHASLLINC